MAEGLSVQISAPRDGARVSGSVEVRVRAESDAAAVESIDISMGELSETLAESAGSVTLDTEGLEPGHYQIEALARDEAGNRGRARITVEVVSEGSSRVWIEPKPAELAPGETCTLHLHLSDTEGIAGFQLTCTWDPAALELGDGEEAVAVGAAVPESADAPMVNTETKGRLVVLLLSPGKELKEDESELLTIKLRALEDAPSAEVPIQWGAGQNDVLLCDSEARLIAPGPERVNGSVTVRSADEAGNGGRDDDA